MTTGTVKTDFWRIDYGANVSGIIKTDLYGMYALLDIGLRAEKEGTTLTIAGTPLDAYSIIRISKNGVLYGIPLVDTSNDVASGIIVRAGIKTKSTIKIT